VSLLDEVAALACTRRRERCSVSVILDSLDDDDRDALLVLLDGRAAGAHIARALTNRGHAVRGQTVQRHRARDCGCP
jgi:hypothetical protein